MQFVPIVHYLCKSHSCAITLWLKILFFTIMGMSTYTIAAAQSVEITGELKKWHAVTLTFEGPEASETSIPNPFRDYRLTVEFSKPTKHYIVPGYFAADGDAADTGAEQGNKWRVHFVPDDTGIWTYEAKMIQGTDAALGGGGTNVKGFENVRGSFTIAATDKTGRDFRGKGLLKYVNERYPQFVETGEYFIKGGADSPENFLAYEDFDGTSDELSLASPHRGGEAKPNRLHRYEPHIDDWNDGDPTWREGKGKGIIGALNYLAAKGMNSVYFLTMNVEGDGNDVWPWINSYARDRFDCSKLDQWEIVFSHMDRIGLMLHVITQETENDQLLNGGDLCLERKLYYRELIARFAHHLALVWNLGEENTNTSEQIKAFCQFFQTIDPYKHPIVVHTYPGQYEQVYKPLLGFSYFHGPSLQMGDMTKTHSETLKWLRESQQRWIVCLDEIGPSHTGVKPDKDDPEHNEVRHHALWGNLMAGGAGVEWYFGYKFDHNDLNCEDWRSRDILWDQTRYALEFFQTHLPFTEMSHADEQLSNPGAYCFAKEGEIYAIYIPNGELTKIKIPEGNYAVQWYNPRTGGALTSGSVKEIKGPGSPDIEIGLPNQDPEKDWVALIKKVQ